MPLGVCLITAGLPRPSPAAELLGKCGFSVWTPDSPGADDGHIYDQAVCLVLDMPADTGVRTLRLLRDYGVKTPAVLVVDGGYNPIFEDLGSPWTLGVIPRTADPRELLRWIESMCITRKLLDQVRSADGAEPAQRLTA